MRFYLSRTRLAEYFLFSSDTRPDYNSVFAPPILSSPSPSLDPHNKNKRRTIAQIALDAQRFKLLREQRSQQEEEKESSPLRWQGISPTESLRLHFPRKCPRINAKMREPSLAGYEPSTACEFLPLNRFYIRCPLLFAISRAALLYCVNCPHPKCTWCVSRSVQVACVCIYLRKNYLRRIVSKESANDDNNVIVVTCTLHGCIYRDTWWVRIRTCTRDISIRNAFRIFV